MKRFVQGTLLIACIFVTVLFVRFGGALFQEGNPIPVLFAIVKLELSDRTYGHVKEEDEQTSFISKNIAESRHEEIFTYMEEKGWAYTEQMGAGLIFEKGEEEAIVSTRLYSKYYIMWDVPKEVL